MANSSEPKNAFQRREYRSLTPTPLDSFPVAGLSGEIDVPGDRLMSLCALLLAAVSDGQSRICGLPDADDIRKMAEAVRALGASVVEEEEVWLINGVGNGALLQPERSLNFENAHIAASLMAGLLSSYHFPVSMTGTSEKSMHPVLDALRGTGLQVDADAGDGVPIAMHGPPLSVPITCRVSVQGDQIKPAILLAGLNIAGTTAVVESEPSRDHLAKLMMQFGAQVDVSTDTDGAQWISVEGQTDLDAQEVVIPGDPFLTSCAVVAGLIVSNSELTIKNVLLCPMQTGFFDALLDMGANLTITGRGRSAGQPVGDLRVRSSRLIGTSVPVTRPLLMGDHYPLLAVAASFAEGKTIMPVLNEPGIGKSTRMVSIFDGLQANGVACNMEEDSLRITGTGRVSGAGTVNAGNDVHVAMALLIMGMAADAPIKIDDAGMINNTCPEFIPFMRSIGANLE